MTSHHGGTEVTTKKNRVLLVLGGTWHDFEGYAGFMRDLLGAAGHALEVTYDFDDLKRLSERSPDVVALYTCLGGSDDGRCVGHDLDADQTSSLVEWVRGGGGLLPLHCATVVAGSNPELIRLLGGVFVSHPPECAFHVYPMYPPHPITEGVHAFEVFDELYVQDYDGAVDVHLVAVHEGIGYPMAWTRSEGGGRVAHIALGHSGKVWDQPVYRRMILQAVEWTRGERDR